MGNMKLAKKMILAAKQSGADFCEVSNLVNKNFVIWPWDKDGRLQIYKKAELSRKQHIELIKYCKKSKNFFFFNFSF